jgi:hypothetical protein
MSAILPHGEITPRRPDCVADETVNGEPVWAANSLLSGKITGNFRDYGSNLKVKPKICTNLQPLIDKFPVKANREFFCENRVFFSQNREPRAANREWAAGLAESCSLRRSNLRPAFLGNPRIHPDYEHIAEGFCFDRDTYHQALELIHRRLQFILGDQKARRSRQSSWSNFSGRRSRFR